ncbi:MAG: alpha/beta hydrolase [Chloroflexaceae bacterium]|nr:alpha/beta hydrolase [Chloroflexaceae bacterium]NJO07108.1 alpha/beta hydrolase [Chloroflexaceae bacterium]
MTIQPTSTSFFDTPQGKLFVVQYGAGSPPLVCLHGAANTHQHWDGPLHVFGDITRSIALDLPGHGLSDPPSYDRVDEYSTALLSLLDAMGLDAAVVVGYSLGGAIALQMALDAPQRVRGLILLSAGATLDVVNNFLEALKDIPDNGIDLLSHMLYSTHATVGIGKTGVEAFQSISLQTLRNDIAVCQAFDIRARLHEITCPALIIAGAQDQIIPPDYAHYLHEHLADSELLILEQAGHLLPIEKPAEIGAAMRSWFISQYRSD